MKMLEKEFIETSNNSNSDSFSIITKQTALNIQIMFIIFHKNNPSHLLVSTVY